MRVTLFLPALILAVAFAAYPPKEIIGRKRLKRPFGGRDMETATTGIS